MADIKRQGHMKTSASLLKFIHHLSQKELASKRFPYKGDAGYTLIELLVVIIMVGILAVIAAPSWLGFINQQRVNKVNEFIFRALQEAQSQAKNKKLSYSVSFREGADKVPEVAVYQTKQIKNDGTTADIGPYNWKSLKNELRIQPGQVVLGTNLDGENKRKDSVDLVVDPNPGSNNNNNNNNSITNKITFDYLGALASPSSTNADPDSNLMIVVAVKKDGRRVEATQRCVKVKTLLGALTTGRGPSGCSATDNGND